MTDDVERRRNITQESIDKSTMERLLRFLDKPSYLLNKRSDGRYEWLCKHGIGHTVSVPKEHAKDKSWWEHGCDGCCSKFKGYNEKKSHKPRSGNKVTKSGNKGKTKGGKK